jgi:hypothetical protein
VVDVAFFRPRLREADPGLPKLDDARAGDADANVEPETVRDADDAVTDECRKSVSGLDFFGDLMTGPELTSIFLALGIMLEVLSI